MHDWTRIPEDEIMLADRHAFTFEHEGDTYSLSYDPSDIHRFGFTMGDHSQTWFIEIQEVKDAAYRWQGMAYSDDWFPGGAAWYEFVWDEEPKIYFWGDQVLIHEDRLVEAISGN